MEESPKKKIRNKEHSKQLLIDAVGTIIIRDGFQKIGINAISKEAGVDKVLIYRYFGNLDGLLKAFAKQKDYWLNVEERLDIQKLEGTPQDLKNVATQLHIDFFRTIWENKEYQELLRWGLVDKNNLTEALALEHAEVAKKILSYFAKVSEKAGIDVYAIGAITISSINYLALHSKTNDTFGSIHLNTEEGKKRIEKGIIDLMELVFDKIESVNKEK
ncbi:TetR/AcrR family transcriptional regulator [Flammeovirgaceae bacterium SG7u.111]|nr:TetR/AcrR family transcriptional regulator [Flammeovirgaceae bacterium SG7u.132]WPO35249.1 TetR/AcrR family transcriptional regulator [Flammeovirgaceae bacterium SG7u.111]